MSQSTRGVVRRLLKEIEAWRTTESKDERGIERLGPVNEDELLSWEAVINGRGIGGGYEEGRWLLRIEVPPQYPLAPPHIAFATPVVHANVALQTGEICLDLLRTGNGTTGAGTTGGKSAGAWTPAYTLVECVHAVRMLLACPEADSPLNVDAAALIRGGDSVAASRLIELWCEEERYDGA